MSYNWTEVAETGLSVALSAPCEGTWQLARGVTAHCAETRDRRHVHLILACEDGMGVVPVPIFSRSFLEILLRLFLDRGTLHSGAEAEAIRALSETAGLLQDLGPLEAELASSPELLEEAARFNFWGV